MWRWWVVCHHHFFKAEFAILPIFTYTSGKRIVFFVLPEAFCGLKYAENAIAAAGESSRRSPDPFVGWGADTSPHTPPHLAPLSHRCSRLWRLHRCAPDTKSWRRHWVRVFQLQRPGDGGARQRDGLPGPNVVVARPQPLPQPAAGRRPLLRRRLQHPDEVVAAGLGARPLSSPPSQPSLSAVAVIRLRDHQRRRRRSRDALLRRPAAA